jgi:hypothetical protein
LNQAKLGRCFVEKELARVRAVAIRRGIWFKTLSKTERALFSLTMRIVRRIRSNVLNQALGSIIEKLQVRTKDGFAAASDILGLPLAERISSIACSWGNTSAARWSSDTSFARFLTIMHINTRSLFEENEST